jgi:subtilisin family serine protease
MADLSARAIDFSGSSGNLDLVGLSPLMARTNGRADISIGLIDGPIALDHPELSPRNIKVLPGQVAGSCADDSSTACAHGTFIAGILLAKRGPAAPGICPGCTLLVRPIFTEAIPDGEIIPGATAEELADAIVAVIDAGARIVNLSLAFRGSSLSGERTLALALDHALRRGAVVVAAAGNQRAVASSAITGHPWVIPVIAYDRRARPMDLSNLSSSIGRRGLGAPGEAVTSLGPAGQPLTLGGTSAATPFVTGTAALLWSEFPNASAAEVRSAVAKAVARRRTAIVPPLLNAWAGYESLLQARSYPK